MPTLFEKRHSLAHVLAMAVLSEQPGAKLATGPATDTGFHYDIALTTPITDADLPRLTEKMRQIIDGNYTFDRRVISPEEARTMFGSNPYKADIVESLIATGTEMTIYQTGEFVDLCEGPHVGSTDQIDLQSFILTRLGGVYYQGDETKPMLTRITGLAFDTKADLEAYQTMIEEAKKRDHKLLGRELDLFVFSDLVGAGLPLWTPRGAMVRNLLDSYVWSLREAAGYERVCIPHITKRALYEKSGHWAKYGDDLFKIKTREDHEYAMKPMNCPHHAQIFAAGLRSYRDLPQRYAETTMVYRDEQSGELNGLSRVLSITQDDAHVFCRENQIPAEMSTVWDIITTFYERFGFVITPRFSRRDMATPEKYLGSADGWDKAEAAIKELIMTRSPDNWIDGEGEAAFYGPKVDFMAKDSIGRTWQVATIQIDFVQPTSFELTCVNEEGKREGVVMIHCAIMGSIERFISILLEHTGGNLPLWLAPEQVRIVPVSAEQIDAAVGLMKNLKATGVRAKVDMGTDSLGKKIRKAREDRIPAWIVVGKKEIESSVYTLETREGEKKEGQSVAALIQEILK